MNARTITINPITRLEGHGKIEIFLNKEGKHALDTEIIYKSSEGSANVSTFDSAS